MTCAAVSEPPVVPASLRRVTVTLAVVAGLLTGCAGIEAPKEVRIPVPVKCVERAPERPSMLSDEELLALDDFGLVVALARDRRIRQGYIGELEAVMEGCR